MKRITINLMYAAIAICGGLTLLVAFYVCYIVLDFLHFMVFGV